jgi:D-glycero-alpha-D-manno-heptose 1-phosphate guanylyltransferase
MPSMMDAVVLCGGSGTRLRNAIGDAPKGMADIAGRPFLELLLRQLHRYGFERAILAVGYRKDVIQSHFGDRACGLSLSYSPESYPLGTAGALRNAADLIRSENALIMNGDSYTDVDLGKFVVKHKEMKAAVSVLVVPADERRDGGSVVLDEIGNLTMFAEKEDLIHAAYINAGVYIMSREMLAAIPPGVEVSLETEVLPRWLRERKCIKGFVCQGRCIDIGTPERYQSARNALANLEVDAMVPQCEGQL